MLNDTSGSWAPSFLRDWGIGTLSSLMITFQGMTPRSLRMTFLGCKAGKRQGEDLYLTETEKDFTIPSFLKYALRKASSGSYSQEESCLKFT